MEIVQLAMLAVFKRVVIFAEKPWEVLAQASQGFKDRVTALKEIIQEIETLIGEHRSGTARNILEEENHLFYKLEHIYLMPVIRVARAVGRTVPGVKNLLATLPVRLTKDNMVATARGVLNATAPHVELLAANGLPEDFREQLEQAIEAIVEKQTVYEDSRRETVRITMALESAVKRGRQEVACLDPIVRMLCRADAVYGPETVRAWITARRMKKLSRATTITEVVPVEVA